MNRESQSFRTYSFKFERSILEFKDGCMVRVQQNVSTKALQFRRDVWSKEYPNDMDNSNYGLKSKFRQQIAKLCTGL